MKLVEDLPLVLSSKDTTSIQEGLNCLGGDLVNTSGSVSIESTHKRILTIRLGRIESIVTQLLYSN